MALQRMIILLSVALGLLLHASSAAAAEDATIERTRQKAAVRGATASRLTEDRASEDTQAYEVDYEGKAAQQRGRLNAPTRPAEPTPKAAVTPKASAPASPQAPAHVGATKPEPAETTADEIGHRRKEPDTSYANVTVVPFNVSMGWFVKPVVGEIAVDSLKASRLQLVSSSLTILDMSHSVSLKNYTAADAANPNTVYEFVNVSLLVVVPEKKYLVPVNAVQMPTRFIRQGLITEQPFIVKKHDFVTGAPMPFTPPAHEKPVAHAGNSTVKGKGALTGADPNLKPETAAPYNGTVDLVGTFIVGGQFAAQGGMQMLINATYVGVDLSMAEFVVKDDVGMRVQPVRIVVSSNRTTSLRSLLDVPKDQAAAAAALKGSMGEDEGTTSIDVKKTKPKGQA